MEYLLTYLSSWCVYGYLPCIADRSHQLEVTQDMLVVVVIQWEAACVSSAVTGHTELSIARSSTDSATECHSFAHTVALTLHTLQYIREHTRHQRYQHQQSLSMQHNGEGRGGRWKWNQILSCPVSPASVCTTLLCCVLWCIWKRRKGYTTSYQCTALYSII